MKKLIMALGLLSIFNVYAVTVDKYAQPTEAEIAKNRACFQELERQGCRTIEEDPEQFRSCLSNSHIALDDYCKKMMLDLYGTK